ncbi:MAG: hypothetical protein V4702_06190 [Patescibacteria group bacterium]
MEPNHNNFAPSTELPNPQEIQSNSEQSMAANPEARGMQMPTPSSGAVQPMQPVQAIPSANPLPTTPFGAPGQGTQQSASALIADDSDLIEKEWVIRAKTIVMQTRDDPHKQNTEMNKVKADYLKKRYNKDLKISEN